MFFLAAREVDSRATLDEKLSPVAPFGNQKSAHQPRSLRRDEHGTKRSDVLIESRSGFSTDRHLLLFPIRARTGGSICVVLSGALNGFGLLSTLLYTISWGPITIRNCAIALSALVPMKSARAALLRPWDCLVNN